jgi:hypothetical protein
MRVFVALCLLFAPAAVLAGTPGVFQGKVYQENGNPGWIYVQGRNGTLRRVEVSRARVVYADSVPAGERSKDPTLDLTQGAEVRVTAEQDGSGEWRATRIEILHIFRRPGDKPAKRAGNQLVRTAKPA